MSLYYFDVEENGVLHVDENGSELEDKLVAKGAAIELLPDLAHTYMVEHNVFLIVVKVRQADGKSIMTAKLEVNIES